MNPRIVIAGGPRTGKSLLAEKAGRALGVEPQHTDDLIGVLEWSECSAEASRWMLEPGPYIVEGCAAVRALRKALAATGERFCDLAIFLTDPIVPQTPGQVSLSRGCLTVWNGIESALRERGIDVWNGLVKRETEEDRRTGT